MLLMRVEVKCPKTEPELKHAGILFETLPWLMGRVMAQTPEGEAYRALETILEPPSIPIPEGSISFFTVEGWRRVRRHVRTLMDGAKKAGQPLQLYKLYWDPGEEDVVYADQFQVMSLIIYPKVYPSTCHIDKHKIPRDLGIIFCIK